MPTGASTSAAQIKFWIILRELMDAVDLLDL